MGAGLQGAVVGTALPANGQRAQGEPAAQQRLAVLHAQNVVGRFQQRRLFRSQQGGYRRLTAGRVGLSRVQPTAQGSGILRREQAASQLQQRRRLAALAAKHQIRHHAGGGKYLDAAIGKGLRRGHSPGQRQLQHQVRAALHDGPGPLVLANQGKITPLDEVAAHGADNGGVGSQQPPGLLQQAQMPAVQRIVFYDHTCNSHKFHPNPVTKK